MEPVDDHLLYYFGSEVLGAGRQAERRLVDLCGGEPERIPVGDRYQSAYVLDSPQGKVLYGQRLHAPDEALDRLDVPGLDFPRPIAGLPTLPRTPGISLSISHRSTDPGAVYLFERHAEGQSRAATAGLGAATSLAFYYDGDPDAAAVPLGDDILTVREHDRWVITHGDGGEVRSFDLDTGAQEVVIADARHLQSITGPGGELHLLYQVLGDDLAEPVRVLDVDAGETRDVTVNDFAAASWGRGDAFAGDWFTDSASDGAAIALRGPGGALVEAYRLDTLEPLAVPDHVAPVWLGGDGVAFGLVLADPVDHVVALWEPLAGRLLEIYRGPAPGPTEIYRDGERVHYTLEDADGSRSWLVVDLTTGETATLLARAGWRRQHLPDGRILSEIGGDLVVLDLDAGVRTTLAERPRKWRYIEGFGVVYLDLDADTPGIWAAPLP